MILSEKSKSDLAFLLYRSRHIVIYTIIGVVAISAELLLRSVLLAYEIGSIFASSIAVVLGILIALILNFRFNFYIPRKRRLRAVLYFCVISVGSVGIQTIIKENLIKVDVSYESLRFIVAGTIFLISYMFHRRFSFRDMRIIGVAVYVNGVEDIAGIHKKIGPYPDFIHVDIVDKTFNPSADDTRLYRLEVIRAYWPDHEIQTHIMSRKPSSWLDEAGLYSDVIYVHDRIDEDFSEVCDKIVAAGARPGLALHADQDFPDLEKLVGAVSEVLVLSIKEPGKSGQEFLASAIDLVERLNSLPQRDNFRLCVDGGITGGTVNLVESELIVSGSAVLNSPEPRRQIMRLQTMFNYEP